MALGNKPTLKDVYNEFSASSRSTSMRQMYEYAFDTNNASGGRLSDFAGMGKPSIANFSVTASSQDSVGGKVDISFDITAGGSPTVTQVQYKIPTDTSWTDLGPGYSKQSQNITISHTEVSMPEPMTQYDFRVQYYNGFNNHSSDWYYSAVITETSSAPLKFGNIGITSATAASYVDVTFNYGDVPSEFELQSSSDGISWITRTLQSSTNWGTTSNPKTGRWTYSGIMVRLRASSQVVNGQTVAASDWSSPYFI